MKKQKQPKPLTGRKLRKFLNKPIDSMGIDELKERYAACWQNIQDNPPTHYLFTQWLDEQAKLRTAITLLEAKEQPENVGNYGKDQSKNTIEQG